MTTPVPLGAPLPQARKRKRSPWPAVLGFLGLVGVASYFAFSNIGQNLEYFVTPTEYQQQQAKYEGKLLRIGGLVQSVSNDPKTLNLTFKVTDGGATYPVQYHGQVSDLFKENQGVVVRGRFEGQTFHANELVVKHSEEYQVPKTQADLKKMLQDSK